MIAKFKIGFLALVLGAVVVQLTGCNTVHGAGKDISNAGHGIEHAAN